MPRKAKPTRGVYERVKGSNDWWIRYADATGKIRREHAGTRVYAVTLLAQRKAALHEGETLPASKRARVKFERIADEALIVSKAAKKEKGYKNDKAHVEMFKAHWAGRDADSLTPLEITEFLNGLDCSPVTKNRYRSTLSMIFREAIKNHRTLTQNPVQGVRQNRENNKVVRWLSEDEETRLRAVLANKHPRRMAMFDTLLHTGMRKGEMFSLLKTNVQLDGVHPTATLTDTKAGGERSIRPIPLNPAAVAAIREALPYSGDSEYVFPANHSDRAYSAGDKWFERACRAAKIPNFTMHCLRHTFASRVLAHGGSLPEVKELLGHGDIKMTLRYAHLQPNHLRDAVNALVRIV